MFALSECRRESFTPLINLFICMGCVDRISLKMDPLPKIQDPPLSAISIFSVLMYKEIIEYVLNMKMHFV